jgi:FADH2 O2-dependent halogenase
MRKIDCDVAILGSGFGGTLLAIILQKLGYSVALLERGSHPRFTIGESSTPLADFKLAAIARRFGLDWLSPFAKYGTWKASYPAVRCGPKRGFSFFHHEAGQFFQPDGANANAFLVAASPDNARGDTHWFRADFDAYLVEQACQSGVCFLDHLNLASIRHEDGWVLEGTRPDGAVRVRAGFVLDATGAGQLLSQTLGLQSVAPADLGTCSRALYSHFANVTRWHDVLQEAHGPTTTAEHTFPCDVAALHQIVDGGWMWVLRFDHGITSAGFSLDPRIHPIRPGETAEAEWRRLLLAYPSLARQFAQAEPVQPFVRTGRLQRRLSRAAGPDWALLPHAAGFLDAWLSPGIAQTLFAVERLGRLFAEEKPGPRRTQRLEAYSSTVLDELAWMDEITASCFACFDRFEIMVSVAILYFVAAHYCEERERAGHASSDSAFLLADEETYRQGASAVCRQALAVAREDADAFRDHVQRLIAPYNLCGLGDPARRNMYPFMGSK